MSQATIKVAALGDIMLDRDVGRHYFNNPEDFKLESIRNILEQYDLVIANLENPVGLRGRPHPKQDPHVAFRCHPETLQVLNNLKVDVVTLANNHLLDYGATTLSDTLVHLDAAGIKHLGAGNNYKQANAPCILTINDMKIAILSSVMIYSASTEKAGRNKPGVADHRTSPLLKSIRALKSQGNIVLVTIHWGIEYCFYPIPYQRKQAMQMIDAGASLVIGHGPHFPQGIEDYKHGKIIHSLGNFIFDEPYLYSAKSFIFGGTVDNDGIAGMHEIYPFDIENHLPVLDHNGLNCRTGVIVNNLGLIYQRKSKSFWRKINNRWFSDIVWRINSMKSLKFAFLPPISFYFDIGFLNFIKKLNLNNLRWLIRSTSSRLFNAR